MKTMLNIFMLLTFAACQVNAEVPETDTNIRTSVLSTEDSIQKADTIVPVGEFKELKMRRRIQSIKMKSSDSLDIYEPAINSPKSAIYSKDGSKFYINSLEGYTTVVFDSKTLAKLKEIKHIFTEKNNSLFKNNENTIFDYKFKQTRKEYNHFMGKPVESCLSHSGKYLWVTYYRRDWDDHAESPSAVAIIDTETDEIVRMMPSGPLPKMIACSPDNKYIAVTHWGDNTVGIIDISGDDINAFNYVSHTIVDYRMVMNFASGTHVNRDSECGNCLRGTVFSPDGKYILIAKMGSSGIAIIQTEGFKYLGTVVGMKSNLRHIVINKGELILSSNKYGFVQKANLNEILALPFTDPTVNVTYDKWESVEVGPGARTIDVTQDGKYIFACVNSGCKIAVVRASDMKVVFNVEASKFPVGMALSPDGKQLVVTSQGKDSTPGSGNAVTVFDVIYE